MSYYKDCDHGRSLNNEDCELRHFVRTVIMIVIFYIPSICIFEAIHFFWSDYYGAFASFALRNTSALSTWTHVIGLKKEVAEANKIMNLSFFPNYNLT